MTSLAFRLKAGYQSVDQRREKSEDTPVRRADRKRPPSRSRAAAPARRRAAPVAGARRRGHPDRAVAPRQQAPARHRICGHGVLLKQVKRLPLDAELLAARAWKKQARTLNKAVQGLGRRAHPRVSRFLAQQRDEYHVACLAVMLAIIHLDSTMGGVGAAEFAQWWIEGIGPGIRRSRLALGRELRKARSDSHALADCQAVVQGAEHSVCAAETLLSAIRARDWPQVAIAAVRFGLSAAEVDQPVLLRKARAEDARHEAKRAAGNARALEFGARVAELYCRHRSKQKHQTALHNARAVVFPQYLKACGLELPADVGKRAKYWRRFVRTLKGYGKPRAAGP